MGGGRELDHYSACAVVKFHSLMEVSIGLEFGRLFTATTSSSELSSESSDSGMSKFRDPETLRSHGCSGLKPMDPTASRFDIRVYFVCRA